MTISMPGRTKLRSFQFLWAVVLVLLTQLAGDYHNYNQAKATNHNTTGPSHENFVQGQKLFGAKDYDGAVDAFLQSIYFARNGYAPSSYFWLGKSYYQKGNADPKAIGAFRKCIQQSLNVEPEAHFMLGQLYLRNKNWPEAENEADLALTQSKSARDRAKSYNLLAKIAETKDPPNYEQASGDYLNALGEQPWRYTEAWVNYAELLMKQQNYEAAFEELRNLLNSRVALKEVPYDRVYTDIGLCMSVKGDHQGALDNWRKALEYNPESAPLRLLIASLLYEEHHWSSALDEYKAYIRLAPADASTAKVRDRITLLEQQLKPPVTFPAAPSAPYALPSDSAPEPTSNLPPTGDIGYRHAKTPEKRDSGF